MSLTYSKHCQTFKMEHFAKIIMPECWYATRNFSGQEEGPVELGHFDKCFVKNTMRPFLSKIRKVFFLSGCMPVSVAENVSISLTLPKYPWKWLNKLFWLCQSSKYTFSSYMFGRCLKMPPVLNKSGFWRILNMARLYMQGLHRVPNLLDYDFICLNNAWICLIMP